MTAGPRVRPAPPSFAPRINRLLLSRVSSSQLAAPDPPSCPSHWLSQVVIAQGDGESLHPRHAVLIDGRPPRRILFNNNKTAIGPSALCTHVRHGAPSQAGGGAAGRSRGAPVFRNARAPSRSMLESARCADESSGRRVCAVAPAAGRRSKAAPEGHGASIWQADKSISSLHVPPRLRHHAPRATSRK